MGAQPNGEGHGRDFGACAHEPCARIWLSRTRALATIVITLATVRSITAAGNRRLTDGDGVRKWHCSRRGRCPSLP
jgi:hypothetical protein